MIILNMIQKEISQPTNVFISYLFLKNANPIEQISFDSIDENKILKFKINNMLLEAANFK